MNSSIECPFAKAFIPTSINRHLCCNFLIWAQSTACLALIASAFSTSAKIIEHNSAFSVPTTMILWLAEKFHAIHGVIDMLEQLPFLVAMLGNKRGPAARQNA